MKDKKHLYVLGLLIGLIFFVPLSGWAQSIILIDFLFPKGVVDGERPLKSTLKL